MSRAPARKGPPPRSSKGGSAAARTPRTIPGGWFVAVGLAFATIILFRDVMLLGQVFLSPDSAAPLGFVRVGEESLKHGVYPLWNPYIFTGMPSFASLAYNPFIYPPDLPVWVITHLLPLPSTTWLVLYYFLAGMGAYLLCREWGMARAPSAFAGLAFLSMPNLVAAGVFGHGSQMMDSAYIPWVLWLAARVFRTGKLTDIAWLALTLGFQMLRGHVQICYYTWLALCLYLVIEVAMGGADRPDQRTRLWRGGAVVLALGLGLALSAFLYLPVHDYVQYSIRGGNENGGVGMDYATAWSFGGVELLTFFVPSAVGFGGGTYWGGMPFTDYPEYMGLGVLLLAMVGVARARSRRTVLYLSLLSLFSLFVSFGHNGFFYRFLYDHLPYFNKFRIPVMILILLQLAVAVLAAEGMTAVLAAREAPKESARTRLALAIALGAAALVFVLGIAPDLWRDNLAAIAQHSHPDMTPKDLETALHAAAGDAIRVGLLALFLLVPAWLGARRSISFALFAAAAFLFGAMDLWIVDQELMAPVLGPPQVLAENNERDAIVDYLQPVADSARVRGKEIRIFALGQDLQTNRFAGFHISSLTGYHAAKPKLADQFVSAVRESLQQGRIPPRGFLAAAGVDFWVIPGQLGGRIPYLRAVFRGNEGSIYQDSLGMDRARLATSYQVVPYDEQFKKMMQINYDPSGPVMLAQALPGPLGPPGGQVRITRYDLNEVDMEADCPGPALLRFSDLYFPDWTARVDGQPTPVLRADFCFRAISLPKGRHRVEWKYEPRALTEGLWISILALLGVGALFGVSAWRSRRPSAGR